QLLLGLQLQAVVRDLGLAALAVLAGAVGPLVHRGLRAAPQVFTHGPVELVLGAVALGHEVTLYVMRPGLPGIGAAISTAVHASSVMRHTPDHGPGREGGAYGRRPRASQGWAGPSGTQTNPSPRCSNRPTPGKGKWPA